MAPKRVKSGTGSAAAGPAVVGNKAWESGLINAQFQEDTWRASVSVVVGERPEDEELIGALQLAIQQPLRKLFSMLSWESTLAKVHEFGNPKAKKPKDVPLYFEVFEAPKVMLDAGEELSCDILAKLLKFQLLGIKASDQQRRAVEQAAEEKIKGRPGPPSPTKDKGAKPSAKGEKGAKKAPEASASTKETKLKRRGEEDETSKFIDDEPDNGPQHYVLVFGFHQPHLLSALDSMGVHVANVIKLGSERPPGAQPEPEQETEIPTETSLDEEAEARREALFAGRTRLQEGFWSGLEAVLNGAPAHSKLYETARLRYTAQESPLTLEKDNAEAVLAFGTRLFEAVACLIYDSLDWRKQHQHYLAKMRLLNVPAVSRGDPRGSLTSPPTETTHAPSPQTPGSKKKLAHEDAPPVPLPPPLTTEVDMRYYSDLLDLIPPEATSVPLILHCMLEQVVVTEQALPPQSVEAAEQRINGLDQSLASYMLTSALSLGLSEQDKKRLMEEFGVEESLEPSTNVQHPLLFNCHNEQALRLRHVPAREGLDPLQVETAMMRMSPAWDLIHSPPPGRTRPARTQQLIHHCTDECLGWPEVERLLHQGVLESMPLTGLDPEGLLTTTGPPTPAPPLIPWDDPVPYAKQLLQNHRLISDTPQSETLITQHEKQESRPPGPRLDLALIQGNRRRCLADWHHAEHHNAQVFPQVLQAALEVYRCVDTFRGSRSHTLYVVCHHPMSPQRQCKERWDVALHTDVGFRKYMEYVADSIADWTRAEEAKMEAARLREAALLEAKSKPVPESPVSMESTPEPCFREDSLKAWKVEQERLKEEELAKKNKAVKDKGGKPAKDAKDTKDAKEVKDTKDAKEAKDTKKGASATKRSAESSAVASPDMLSTPFGDNRAELHSTGESAINFTGYSMEGSLIHVKGEVQSLFPSDGGHIKVEHVHFVHGSTLLKVCVRKDKHHFYTHVSQATKAHEEKDPKEPATADRGASRPAMSRTVRQGSFTALLSNGVQLAYSCCGPRGQHTAPGDPGSTHSSEGQRPTSSSLTLGPGPVSPASKGGPPLTPTLASNGAGPKAEPSPIPGPSPLAPPPFHSLSLSVPSGLRLQFLREDALCAEEPCVMVRQSFPLRGADQRWGAGGQGLPLPRELSRVITSQGAVVRYMADGSTQVLFADGSVSSSPDSGPVWPPAPVPPPREEEPVKEQPTPEPKDTKEKKGKPGSKQSAPPAPPAPAEQAEPEPRPEEKAPVLGGYWVTTTPSGLRLATEGNTLKQAAPVLAFRATDPFSKTVVVTREDKVLSVLDPEGSVTVEHADGTRITSLYQEKALHHSLTHLPSGERVESMRCRGESAGQRERLVMVEGEGLATVVMYPERHACNVFLGDGTVLTASCRGAYQVFPPSEGLLLIQEGGTCVYSPEPGQSPTLTSDPDLTFTPEGQPGSYVMSHTGNVACEVTDPHGNHFQVMEDGRTAVVTTIPLDRTWEQQQQQEEEEEEREGQEEDGELAHLNTVRQEHWPRLFLVHEDGSGTELLSSQTVQELLYQAYSDPTVALLQEPLSDSDGVLGLTVLKPCPLNVWIKWLLAKQSQDMVPANLKSRTWENFPSVERKTPGPPFGTELGRGLSIRTRPAPPPQRPVPSCPEALEVRQLVRHRPADRQLRATLDARLKGLMEEVLRRERLSEEMLQKEPRSQEEQLHAWQLLQLVLSLPESECYSHSLENKSSEAIATMYCQALSGGLPPEARGEDASRMSSDFSSEDQQESQWSRRIEQHREELSEERQLRAALRNGVIPPYFHPENAHMLPDISSLSRELPPFPKSSLTESILRDAPQEIAQQPFKPAPSHATERNATPSERPTNPTPQTAGESHHRVPSVGRALELDVAGNPRRSPVRLPPSILSAKPSNVPNQQFLAVEEPVRRKSRMVSLSGPKPPARGFQLLPARVDFGTLKEGSTYAVTVAMKNVGVDTCRFSVKQPSPATGVRVLYNPGPVPAGLLAELEVQLFAMVVVHEDSAEPENHISHQIEIRTETEILYLPVTAILPEELFDSSAKDRTIRHAAGVSKVRLLSSTPSVRRGVTLPHRPSTGNTQTTTGEDAITE